MVSAKRIFSMMKLMMTIKVTMKIVGNTRFSPGTFTRRFKKLNQSSIVHSTNKVIKLCFILSKLRLSGIHVPLTVLHKNLVAKVVFVVQVPRRSLYLWIPTTAKELRYQAKENLLAKKSPLLN